MAILGANKQPVANWSELPSHMLQLISKKLPDLSDFIRFRAVCQNWRFSVAISDISPLLPWLLFVPFKYSRREEHNLFYSLSSRKFFITPAAPNHIFRRSSHRYLLLWSRSTLHSLFNPITNHVVRLPPINLDCYDVVHSDGDSILICRQYWDRDESFLQIYRWQFGVARWSTRDIYLWGNIRRLRLQAYCKGLYFYINQFDWTTNVFDGTTLECVLEIRPPVCTSDFTGFNYLIKSSDELLGVCRLPSTSVMDSSFDIYRLHGENGNFNWAKVSDIGDSIVLLDKFPGTELKKLLVFMNPSILRGAGLFPVSGDKDVN
ncbi:hypothetical protein LUZ61_014702 [Rhynchospora tenuis]|uniref:F-box domain-containing protein n=1 Tax=Rhynchospora tenuis TaxID=198213 RepID=A0AAD5Z1Z7_9POAL|nr:hypothetical protein LUZ61_014702 [Rhynchospora tenuis]